MLALLLIVAIIVVGIWFRPWEPEPEAAPEPTARSKLKEVDRSLAVPADLLAEIINLLDVAVPDLGTRSDLQEYVPDGDLIRTVTRRYTKNPGSPGYDRATAAYQRLIELESAGINVQSIAASSAQRLETYRTLKLFGEAETEPAPWDASAEFESTALW